MSKKNRRLDFKSKVGRPPKLSTKEVFLMLMIFVRHYPTYEVLYPYPIFIYTEI